MFNHFHVDHKKGSIHHELAFPSKFVLGRSSYVNLHDECVWCFQCTVQMSHQYSTALLNLCGHTCGKRLGHLKSQCQYVLKLYCLYLLILPIHYTFILYIMMFSKYLLAYFWSLTKLRMFVNLHVHSAFSHKGCLGHPLMDDCAYLCISVLRLKREIKISQFCKCMDDSK